MTDLQVLVPADLIEQIRRKATTTKRMTATGVVYWVLNEFLKK